MILAPCSWNDVFASVSAYSKGRLFPSEEEGWKKVVWQETKPNVKMKVLAVIAALVHKLMIMIRGLLPATCGYSTPAQTWIFYRLNTQSFSKSSDWWCAIQVASSVMAFHAVIHYSKSSHLWNSWESPKGSSCFISGADIHSVYSVSDFRGCLHSPAI